MDEQVREYVEQYPSAIVNMYHTLRTLILDSAPATGKAVGEAAKLLCGGSLCPADSV